MRKKDRKIKKVQRRCETYDRKIERVSKDSVGQSRLPRILSEHHASFEEFVSAMTVIEARLEVMEKALRAPFFVYVPTPLRIELAEPRIWS